MTTIFLRLDEVLEIHRDQIERYGGAEGIRDMGLLQSALAMPAVGFGGQYLHADVFEMAATYLYHIARNHPFIDGNKRTGAVAAVVFLAMNGVETDADENEFEALVRAVARGDADKAAAGQFLKRHSRSA